MSIIERALAKAKQQDRAAVEDAEGLAHRPEAAPGPETGPTFAGKPAPTEGDPGSSVSAPPVGSGLAREEGDPGAIASAPPGGSGNAREEGDPGSTVSAPPGGSGLAREDGAPVHEALVQAPPNVVAAPASAQAAEPDPRSALAPDARTDPAAPPLLRVEDLRCAFDVSKPFLNRLLERERRRWLKAVDGVSFDIPRGQTFALVGESGCGKSTVARLIVGLYEPSAGRIVFDGRDVAQVRSSAERQKLRRRFQMIFQDPYASLNPRWGSSASSPSRSACSASSATRRRSAPASPNC